MTTSFPHFARLANSAALTLAGAMVSAAPAFAATAAERPFASPSVVQSVTPPGVGNLGQVTLSLGLVLAVIFAAAWLVRRMRGFGRPGAGTLDVIADLPVGQKERAVLIRVGTTQILLGVAPGRVSTLHVLTEPVELTPATTQGPMNQGPVNQGPSSGERPSFKDLLMKSLGK